MEDPTAPETYLGYFRLPKLKSVIAFFLGLFCILCFKKLIVFGRRWKNILIDWGYRSTNVPSLWTKDAIVDQDTAGTLPSIPSPSHKPSKRIPALRVPDAWSNFMLTWLHLNLNTVGNLVPVWISAINTELQRLTTRELTQDSGCVLDASVPYCEVKIDSVRPPMSPPRLSSMETSASASTKELHFHCTLSTPELFLALSARRTQPSPVNETDSTIEQYLLHLQQVTGRVQIICAVLEGDYVLLSWKLVSPLLTQPLVLLDGNLTPVINLGNSEARWLKDNVYLAIQSAVTRLVINPLCFTAVEQPPPPPPPTRSTSVSQAVDVKQQSPLDSEPPILPASMEASNIMHLRVLYAVLLDPLNVDSFDPLLVAPLRCCVHWNMTLARIEDQAVGDADGLVLATDALPLEPKYWLENDDAERSRTMSASPLFSANSSVVMWNKDAYVPVTDAFSNLLDVSLFTEPISDSASRICGHAILPLPKLNEDPAKSQHVLLIDCYPGDPNDDWHSVSKSSDVRARFMLILQVQLFTGAVPVEPSSDHVAPPTSLPSPAASRNHPGDTTSLNRQDALSTEQLIQFMSPSTREPVFSNWSEHLQRKRSRSDGDDRKVPQTSSSTSDAFYNQNLSLTAQVDSQKWTNHQSTSRQAYSPISVQTAFGLEDSNTSFQPVQRSASLKRGDRKKFSLRRSLTRSLRKKTSSTLSTQTVASPISLTPSATTIDCPPSVNEIAKPSKSRFRRLFGLRRKSDSKQDIAPDRRMSN